MEALLKEGTLKSNAEFESLQKAQQSAKRALVRAKKAMLEAKSTCQQAFDQNEASDDRSFELLTACRQAKCMHQYHKAGHKLAKHRLQRWLEAYLKMVEVPRESMKIKAVKPKIKKVKPTKNIEMKPAKARQPTTF